jgi:integrase
MRAGPHNTRDANSCSGTLGQMCWQIKRCDWLRKNLAERTPVAHSHSRRWVAEYYEPYARENLKPSTVRGYSKLWETLCPRVGEIRLRDFKTVDAANMLTYFAGKGWGRHSLQHAKSLLSGIFTYAKNLGVLDGVNPVQGSIIPRKAAAPAETRASTPDEVVAILDVLRRAKELDERSRLQAQTAIALMFFGGLCPGEARGATWENYDGRTLSVKQSVWRAHTTDPKITERTRNLPKQRVPQSRF